MGGRHALQLGVDDEVQQSLAVLGDPPSDLAAAGQRLVEQHPPGVAVLVEEREERLDAATEHVRGSRGGGHGVGDGLQERVPGALHAGDVQLLLVAEVGVQQWLGDADLGRHVIHRHGRESPRGEAGVGGVQDLALALGPRQPAAPAGSAVGSFALGSSAGEVTTI